MLTPANFQMSPWVQWEQSKLTEQYEDFVAGRRKLYPKYFYTGNSSLAKSHLLTVGGFDQQFRRAEDVELAYRLKDIGLTFEFNMAASGYHYAERSFASWITIPYEYGRNDVLFAKLKGHTWMIRTNIWEYLNRHLFIKVLVWLCLDRPLLTRTALRFLTVAAKVGHRYQLAKVYLLAYSGIFNMRHFQGFSDEYGGRTAFFDGVKRYIKGDFPE
jgi:GT2 family glycosyltransferase